jgi:hypothetical protein
MRNETHTFQPDFYLTCCREVLRPQPLLDYDSGGVANSVYWKLLPGLRHTNPGFETCIAVRHRDYKWLGATGKVHRCGGRAQAACATHKQHDMKRQTQAGPSLH